MNELKERIKMISEELFEGNATKFGKSVGSSDTSISNYINGTSFPGFQFLYNVCSQLNISPNWLILGLGEKDLTININNHGNGNTVGIQKVGDNNSSVSQVIHSNELLHTENEALKREIILLREMLELYKKSEK